MKLVQILLPLFNNNQEAFPPVYYSQIREELTSRYGGVTAYSHSPATGIWKENGEKTIQDKIVIYEVMTDVTDREWWSIFKRRAERIFQQEEIVIRAIQIDIF